MIKVKFASDGRDDSDIGGGAGGSDCGGGEA